MRDSEVASVIASAFSGCDDECCTVAGWRWQWRRTRLEALMRCSEYSHSFNIDNEPPLTSMSGISVILQHKMDVLINKARKLGYSMEDFFKQGLLHALA